MAQKPGMMECPKCGYHQPADRFCAQCGINMDNFKPKSSLLKNPYLQLFVVAIALFGILFFINQQAKKRVAERAQAIEESESAYTSDFSSQEAEAEMEKIRREQEQRKQARERQRARAAQATPKPTPVTITAPKLKKQTALKVIFAEVSRGFLEELSTNATPGSPYGNHVSGAFKSFSELFKKGQEAKQLKSLATSSTERIEKDQVITVFEGYEDGDLEQDLGFTIQITPTQVTQDHIQLQVEMMRELKEFEGDQPVLIDQPFQDSLRIERTAGAFLAGVLQPPRQEIPEPEREVLSGTILKVYNSPDFLNGESVFVIFLRVDGFD